MANLTRDDITTLAMMWTNLEDKAYIILNDYYLSQDSYVRVLDKMTIPTGDLEQGLVKYVFRPLLMYGTIPYGLEWKDIAWYHKNNGYMAVVPLGTSSFETGQIPRDVTKDEERLIFGVSISALFYVFRIPAMRARPDLFQKAEISCSLAFQSAMNAPERFTYLRQVVKKWSKIIKNLKASYGITAKFCPPKRSRVPIDTTKQFIVYEEENQQPRLKRMPAMTVEGGGFSAVSFLK